MPNIISDWNNAINSELRGPIVVLGASGFVGANLLNFLLKYRQDVYGTYNELYPWRLKEIPQANLFRLNIFVEDEIEQMLETLKPRTVFDCIAYGAYSFQNDRDLIYRSNFLIKIGLLEQLEKYGIERYVHAGSSSEYGRNSSGPNENIELTPNSHYASSKVAMAGAINYFGKCRNFPCLNLRLYSVYGPYEDSSRLMPNIVLKGLERNLPPFVNPEISRDYVYVDDVSRAFVAGAINLHPEMYGESVNIGTGVQTTIREVAKYAKDEFLIDDEPSYSMPNRSWDVENWFSNPEKAEKLLGWKATISLKEGIRKLTEWTKNLSAREDYIASSKKILIDSNYSVSAVIACYKDAQAIPVMYERLKAVFHNLGVEYEIIFVNDNSPDNSEEIIRELSTEDPNVIGITHSRNFGSQSAFLSGMEKSSKNSVVLLDGDLQDPPELISEMVNLWKEGYEVVYGRRVKREASLFMSLSYRLFYILFEKFSYISIPRDAGDFSLMERRVVNHILSFPERDFLLRGVRAFAGFKQVGVDYVRPERMFGTTTNSLIKNIGWAKKGIFAYSNSPLNFISTAGIILFAVVILLSLIQLVARFLFPELSPRGITTVLLVISFFGAFNILAVAIVGEYLGKVLEEVKHRPRYIRRSIIRYGKIDESHSTE